MSSISALYYESLSTAAKEKNDILELPVKSGNQITREKIRDYYSKVADFIFPYLKNRPQVLKRDFKENTIVFNFRKKKQAVQKVPVFAGIDYEPDIRDEESIVCYNKETIEYINNLGCLEITPWHSSVENLENPDYLIISIEPSKRNTFYQCVRVAKIVKTILDKCNIEGYCKTSGDTGLHIYIPVAKKYNYRPVRELAYTICLHVNVKAPELTSLKKDQAMATQRIHLNYDLNRHGYTLVAPYSIRPYSWGPVSTPLLWSELTDDLNPYDFNINTIPARLEKLGDIFSGVLDRGIDIENCMKILQNE